MLEIILLLVFFIGACFGSFIALISHRLPLISTHSQLAKIDFTWLESIPLLSCHHLEKRLKNYQPSSHSLFFLTEGLSGLLFSTYYLNYDLNPNFLPVYLLLFMALSLSISDLLYLEIPILTFLLFFSLIFLTNLSLNFILPLDFFAAGTIFIFLNILKFFFSNGLGSGDILLLVSWSLFLGLYAVLVIILFACFSGLLFFILNKQERQSQIAFIPHLSLGLFFYLVTI